MVGRVREAASWRKRTNRTRYSNAAFQMNHSFSNFILLTFFILVSTFYVFSWNLGILWDLLLVFCFQFVSVFFLISISKSLLSSFGVLLWVFFCIALSSNLITFNLTCFVLTFVVVLRWPGLPNPPCWQTLVWTWWNYSVGSTRPIFWWLHRRSFTNK